MDIPRELKLILAPNEVLLPGALTKFSFTYPKSSHIVRELMTTEGNQFLGFVPCKNLNDPIEGSIGVAACVMDLTTIAWSNKSFFVTLLGFIRIRIDKVLTKDAYPLASVSVIADSFKDSEGDEDLTRTLEEFKSNAIQFLGNNETVLHNVIQSKKFKRLFGNILQKTVVIDIFANFVTSSFDEKLDILKTIDPLERLKKVIPLFNRHVRVGDDVIREKLPIRIGVINSPPPIMIKSMKRFNGGPHMNGGDEDDELEDKLRSLNLPEVAAKVVNRELNQLKRLSRHHMDYAVHKNYLELIAELPWNVRSNETINIAKSKQDLEVDHYGMEKVKKRLLEYLAVRLLKADLKGPILCLVGAPGVGKTSVARSIANSMGRKFQRISLGGVCHTSDIRGHRKTYVGAMPGRIIQAIKISAVKNPVILLDEIDKLGKGVSGDPASALLEVLDSEQNNTFVDLYLNIPFDLSEVIFIATANTTKSIPPALRDRLEIIQMPGYTTEEKKLIAERHLLPKQLREHGLPPFAISLPEESLSLLISGYTREAGVRSLERKLAALCRQAAINATYANTDEIINKSNNSQTLLVTKEVLEDILGPVVFEGGMLGWKEDMPGIAVGLCWTAVGGDVLIVEATRVSGGSNALVLTGQLGSVMKESAKLAFNWFKVMAFKYGLEEYLEHMADSSDVHIHFPAGAISKEGPSAGITIAVALLSLFSGVPVVPDLALTGELTLRGSVLPVGGIKEKLIAAYNAGIKTVIIPEKCRKHLHDVPNNILEHLDVILAGDMDDVIKAAFNGQIVSRKSSILTSKL